MRFAMPVAGTALPCALLLTCIMPFWNPANASVVLANTRVVYPADAREITVRLTNHRATPALVEAWIEPAEATASTSAPSVSPDFAVTPPLLRIEPGKGQALRVHRLTADFPEDRETLFWLNVLDVPADAAHAGARGVLKMNMRSRVKLFLRPVKLPGTANRAPERLEWRLIPGTERDPPTLRLHNPTPYHVTIARVIVGGGAMDLRGEMVPPFGRLLLPLDAPALPGGTADARRRADALRTAGTVSFRFINDSGGAILRTARLLPDTPDQASP